jgi:hypothetical protein
MGGGPSAGGGPEGALENKGVGEPGLVESLLPLWGSGRSALNAFQNGNWGWGLFYSAAAVSDVFLVKSLATAGIKLAVYGGPKLAAALGLRSLTKGALAGATEFQLKLAARGLIRKIAGTRGLKHSFDRHAAQWFSRHGGKPSIQAWQKLIEEATESTKIVPWTTGPDKTVGHLARIGGNKWFFVEYYTEGPRANELATAFIPNKDQLRAMLRLLGK